jgi:hypothetical protein
MANQTFWSRPLESSTCSHVQILVKHRLGRSNPTGPAALDAVFSTFIQNTDAASTMAPVPAKTTEAPSRNPPNPPSNGRLPDYRDVRTSSARYAVGRALAVRTAGTITHTWDLARAVRLDDTLSPVLVAGVGDHPDEIYDGLAGGARRSPGT